MYYILVPCLSVAAINNGVTNVSTNGSVTFVTYMCNLGYSLVGKDVLTCTVLGVFDTNPPECS